jgi:hypothetical protein
MTRRKGTARYLRFGGLEAADWRTVAFFAPRASAVFFFAAPVRARLLAAAPRTGRDGEGRDGLERAGGSGADCRAAFGSRMRSPACGERATSVNRICSPMAEYAHISAV